MQEAHPGLHVHPSTLTAVAPARRQGAQGVLDHASHAQLDSEFGTHRDDDVVKKILEGGDMQTTSVRSPLSSAKSF